MYIKKCARCATLLLIVCFTQFSVWIFFCGKLWLFAESLEVESFVPKIKINQSQLLSAFLLEEK